MTFGKLYNPNKTKTFFFYNMEWRKLIQGQTLNQTVPLGIYVWRRLFSSCANP